MECISILEREIADLRKTLAEKENELYEIKKKWISKPQLDNQMQVDSNGYNNQAHVDPLPRWAIERYSRQILLPDIGVEGQVALMAARVLVVGCGGLGCPAAAYLAGAGVGEIGLVDYDTVDVSNIHRQLLHGESDQARGKVQSAASALRRINSNITVTPYEVQLTSNNALDIVGKYHVILDCTDNAPTRYLLNDACALTKLPLISGSALKMEGQLTVYGYHGPKDPNEKEAYQGPCYRCLFPTPPPPETVGSCSADGVAGPVCGLIGALQALEAIKLIVGHSRSKLLVERMVIFDGEDCSFRTVKLRPRNLECAACSATPTITRLIDYETFCKAKAKEKDLDLYILPPSHRISAVELSGLLSRSHLLVDVRSAPEFNMCRIEGAVNYPIEALWGNVLDKLVGEIRTCDAPVTFVCRRGNDSQVAAQRVLDALHKHSLDQGKWDSLDKDKEPLDTKDKCYNKDTADSYKQDKETLDTRARVRDVIGGLHAWAKYVDHNFPVY